MTLHKFFVGSYDNVYFKSLIIAHLMFSIFGCRVHKKFVKLFNDHVTLLNYDINLHFEK